MQKSVSLVSKTPLLMWLLAALFAAAAFGFGLGLSTPVFLIASFLMIPIKPIRRFLKDKFRISAVVVVAVSFAVAVGAFLLVPSIENSPVGKLIYGDSQMPNDENTDGYDNQFGNYVGANISLSSVPEYSGEPYVVINSNIPDFTAEDKRTEGTFERYSPFDSLGRCGVAFACLGIDTMPTEARGDISAVKPSGWQKTYYEFVDGNSLYNRCHLIGFQLSAENANKYNLVTGTRYMNVEGMLPFENMVADYIEQTGNRVLYKVSPIFDGNDLVCKGVQMEAYSLEDGGEGVCFNVYCYNVQPNVVIDYSNGDNYEETAPDFATAA